MDGPLLLENGALWLLSRPQPPPADPGELARLLVLGRLPPREDLARILRCREVVLLDAQRLGRWAHALAFLQDVEKLKRIVAAGYAPLKPWRRRDLAGWLEGRWARLRELRSCLEELEPGQVRGRARGNPVPALEGRVLMPWSRAIGGAPARRARREAWREAELLSWARWTVSVCALLFGQQVGTIVEEELSDSLDPDFLRRHVLQRLEWTRQWLHWGAKFGRLFRVQAAHVFHRLGFPGSLVNAHFERSARRGGRRGRELARATEEAIEGILSFLDFDAWRQRVRASLFSPSLLARAVRPSSPVETLLGVCDEIARRLGESATPLGRAPDGVLERRLALLLAHPGTLSGIPAAFPPATSRKSPEGIERIVQELPPDRMRDLAPWLPEILRVGEMFVREKLLNSDVPAEDVGRVLRLGLAHAVSRFAHDARRLRLYLRLVAEGGEVEAVADSGFAEWMAQLLAEGSDWQVRVLAAFAEGLGQSQLSAEAAMQLQWVCHALGHEDPEARVALENWADSPGVPLTPRLRRVAREMGISEKRLSVFLRDWRAGHETEMPRFLKDLLEFEDRIAAQRHHLRLRLAAPGLEEAHRRDLEARLEKLEDPDWVQGRREHLVREARRKFSRTEETIRWPALRRVLWDLLRGALRRRAGITLEEDARRMEAWLPLLALIREEKVRPYLARFVQDVQRGRPLWQWPKNLAWVQEAERHGVRVRRWLEGFSKRVHLGDEEFRLETESDPLVALHLGTFYKTCLTVPSGMFAAVAFLVVVDANKHVVYLKDQRGTVVARKLIAATADGRLYGYFVYSHRFELRLNAVIDTEVLRFGHECGLRPAVDGHPEDLHGPSLSRAGEEPVDWGGGEREKTRREEAISRDLQEEEALFRAIGSRDVPTLQRLARTAEWDRRGRAAWELVLLGGPLDPSAREVLDRRQLYVATVKGILPWEALLEDEGYVDAEEWLRVFGDSFELALEDLPGDPAVALQGFWSLCPEAVSQIAPASLRNKVVPWQWFARGTGPALSVVEPLCRLLNETVQTRDWLWALWAKSLVSLGLRAAAVLSPEPDALRGALWKSRGAFQKLLLHLLSGTKVPGVSPLLRRMLREGRAEDPGLAALALAVQEGRGAAAFLERIAPRLPRSLALAAAVGRSGARADFGRILPKGSLPSLLKRPQALEFLRMAQPASLLRALQDRIVEAAEAVTASRRGREGQRERARLRWWVTRLALLGPVDEGLGLEAVRRRLETRFPELDLARVARGCFAMEAVMRTLARWERGQEEASDGEMILRALDQALLGEGAEERLPQPEEWRKLLADQGLALLEDAIVRALHEARAVESAARLLLALRGAAGARSVAFGFLVLLFRDRLEVLPPELLVREVGALIGEVFCDRNHPVLSKMETLAASWRALPEEVRAACIDRVARSFEDFPDAVTERRSLRSVAWRTHLLGGSELLDILRRLWTKLGRVSLYEVVEAADAVVEWFAPSSAERLLQALGRLLEDRHLGIQTLAEFLRFEQPNCPRRVVRFLAGEIVRRFGSGRALEMAKECPKHRVKGGILLQALGEELQAAALK
jgi:hypothetical protein